MKPLFEFLSDNQAFQDWANKEEDYEYIKEYIKKATLFAMEVELSEAQKRYITHYVIEGKTMDEISNMYNVNKSTVSRVIKAGRTNLMHVLRYTAPWLLNAEMCKIDRRRWK